MMTDKEFLQYVREKEADYRRKREITRKKAGFAAGGVLLAALMIGAITLAGGVFRGSQTDPGGESDPTRQAQIPSECGPTDPVKVAEGTGEQTQPGTGAVETGNSTSETLPYQMVMGEASRGYPSLNGGADVFRERTSEEDPWLFHVRYAVGEQTESKYVNGMKQDPQVCAIIRDYESWLGYAAGLRFIDGSTEESAAGKEMMAVYTPEWFEKNALILIDYTVGLSGRIEFFRADRSGNELQVLLLGHLSKAWTPGALPCTEWIVTAETPKEYLDGIESAEAFYTAYPKAAGNDYQNENTGLLEHGELFQRDYRKTTGQLVSEVSYAVGARHFRSEKGTPNLKLVVRDRQTLVGEVAKLAFSDGTGTDSEAGRELLEKYDEAWFDAHSLILLDTYGTYTDSLEFLFADPEGDTLHLFFEEHTGAWPGIDEITEWIIVLEGDKNTWECFEEVTIGKLHVMDLDDEERFYGFRSHGDLFGREY